MVAEDNVSWTLNNVRIRYSSIGPRKKVIEIFYMVYFQTSSSSKNILGHGDF